MEGNSVRERMRVAERLRKSERKAEGKIGATFSRKGRAGRNERWAEREREKRRARRLSRGREEDGKRVTQAESGPHGQFLGAINDEPTERGHTRIFLRVGRPCFVRVSHLTLTLPERIFYRGRARLYLVT